MKIFFFLPPLGLFPATLGADSLQIQLYKMFPVLIKRHCWPIEILNLCCRVSAGRSQRAGGAAGICG